MVWGGSLNKNGSDQIRKIIEAEKVIRFLESFKINLKEEQITVIQNTIEIILEYFSEKENS